MTAAPGVVDRLRRPEYTGENRCVPCTLVNLAIAALLAVLVALLLPTRGAPALGGLVLLGAVGAIYLRGYLVPGTPWFTRTYFPDRLLRWFDKSPAANGAVESDWGDSLDVEATLVRAGALTECADVDDLCLTPAFRDDWNRRLAELREEDTSRADLAGLLGVDPDDLEFDEFGDAFLARTDGRRVGQWESRAAFLADVGAADVLADWSGWDALDVGQRGELLNGVRLFVETCPTCGGRVVFDEEVARSCCRQYDVAVVACEDCGARLFEAELTDPG